MNTVIPRPPKVEMDFTAPIGEQKSVECPVGPLLTMS